MPKMKTNRGAAKRFKVTASGKVKFRRANRNHISTKNPPKVVRQRRGGVILADANAKAVFSMIGKQKQRKPQATAEQEAEK